MTENKFSKYLLYAIGEIILVVIGILIALQINNWNENRKNRDQEALLLHSLASEFETNLGIFDSVFSHHQIKEDYVQRLIHYGKEPIGFEKLDTILEVLTYNYTINLSSTIYRSSVNSGKLDFIRDAKLKNTIAAFEDKYIDFQEEELIAMELTNQEIVPFINDHITVRYPFGMRNESELSEDHLTYKNLVTDPKFRNRLITLKGVFWDITTEGKNLRGEIEKIIHEIQLELDKK